ESLDWHLLQYPVHATLQRWVEDLNKIYRGESALHELDFDPGGFEWIDCNDHLHGVLTLMRKGHSENDMIIVACNFTPVPRLGYRVGVPRSGYWREILNSDAKEYGGSGLGNLGGVEASPIPFHGRPHSLNLTLPPLAVVFLKTEG
ncbi:MAG: alpha amylase C-terminal domain-containing protein, partial [Deltaproteobacteria bacterium]